jgi:hypothetical protein
MGQRRWDAFVFQAGSKPCGDNTDVVEVQLFEVLKEVIEDS